MDKLLSVYDFFECMNTYFNRYTHSNIEKIVIIYLTKWMNRNPKTVHLTDSY